MTKAEMTALRAEWRERLGHWRETGLSAAAYCREHDLSIWKFRYWVRRIAELDGDDSSGFAQVTTSGSGLSLVVPGGLRLEVEPGFDHATLRQFLQAVCLPC